jgi:hypothetical protein
MLILDKIYSLGAHDLYIKYVLQKLPFHISNQAFDIIESYQNYNFIQEKKDSFIPTNNPEDIELTPNQIDSWAFQSLKSEPKVFLEINESKSIIMTNKSKK